MKKTLVALAVLAASGASFAQVTITGQFGFGYGASTAGSTTSSGLGISDSNVTFAASEDLGSGMKIAANLKLDGVSRAGVTGGDESVSLSGGFGTLSMGLVEFDTDVADQFGTFMGNTIVTAGLVDSERTADFVQYSTSFGPVGLSVRHTENASVRPANGAGIGIGAAGSSAQRLNTIAASYAAGALSIKADYSVYDNKPDSSAVPLFDTRTTLGGNYDFGVASVGLGFQSVKWTQGYSVADSFVGAKIPFGALVVGVDYINSKLSGTPTNDATYSGLGIQATYNLSKLTNVRFRVANFNGQLASVGSDKTTSYSLDLYKNF